MVGEIRFLEFNLMCTHINRTQYVEGNHCRTAGGQFVTTPPSGGGCTDRLTHRVNDPDQEDALEEGGNPNKSMKKEETWVASLPNPHTTHTDTKTHN